MIVHARQDNRLASKTIWGLYTTPAGEDIEIPLSDAGTCNYIAERYRKIADKNNRVEHLVAKIILTGEKVGFYVHPEGVDV